MVADNLNGKGAVNELPAMRTLSCRIDLRPYRNPLRPNVLNDAHKPTLLIVYDTLWNSPLLAPLPLPTKRRVEEHDAVC